MPLRSSQAWKSASVALASSTMPGHVVAERRDLVGDRVGEQHADPGQRPRAARASRSSTATPRGKRARRSSVTNGFSSSAISPATMNSSSTGPAARSSAHGAEHRQRQHHELDPARHDDRRDPAGGSGSVGDRRGVAVARGRLGARAGMRQYAPRPRRYRAAHDRDPLRRRRRRRAPAAARCASCSPGCARSTALDFVVVNGENAAGGIGITPKQADELFAPAST